MNAVENAQSCSVNNDMAWQRTFPPGFQDMLEFGFIEALTGRRARRFFMGAEIPDGVLAYKSRRDPVPLTELEKLLVVTACGGNTGWHHMLYRAKLYAPHLSNYSGVAGGRTFPSAAGFHTSNTFFTDDEASICSTIVMPQPARTGRLAVRLTSKPRSTASKRGSKSCATVGLGYLRKCPMSRRTTPGWSIARAHFL